MCGRLRKAWVDGRRGEKNEQVSVWLDTESLRALHNWQCPGTSINCFQSQREWQVWRKLVFTTYEVKVHSCFQMSWHGVGFFSLGVIHWQTTFACPSLSENLSNPLEKYEELKADKARLLLCPVSVRDNLHPVVQKRQLDNHWLAAPSFVFSSIASPIRAGCRQKHVFPLLGEAACPSGVFYFSPLQAHSQWWVWEGRDLALTSTCESNCLHRRLLN